MKIIAGLLAILILAPAVVMACDCCPSQPEGTLRIERAACYSCCPESLESGRDRGTLNEKEIPALLHHSLIGEVMPQVQTVDRPHKEKSVPALEGSPPLSPLSLSTILRI